MEITQARQIKVIQDTDGIPVRLMATADAADDLLRTVRHWFEASLAKHQLQLPPLKVSVVQRLAGDASTMGKYQPVECRLPRGDSNDRALERRCAP